MYLTGRRSDWFASIPITAPRGFGATVKLRYLYGGLWWRSVYGVDPLSTIHVQTEIPYRGFISTVFPPVFHRNCFSTVPIFPPFLYRGFHRGYLTTADPPLYHYYSSYS